MNKHIENYFEFEFKRLKVFPSMISPWINYYDYRNYCIMSIYNEKKIQVTPARCEFFKEMSIMIGLSNSKTRALFCKFILSKFKC